jgi:hypothetical protein
MAYCFIVVRRGFAAMGAISLLAAIGLGSGRLLNHLPHVRSVKPGRPEKKLITQRPTDPHALYLVEDRNPPSDYPIKTDEEREIKVTDIDDAGDICGETGVFGSFRPHELFLFSRGRASVVHFPKGELPWLDPHLSPEGVLCGISRHGGQQHLYLYSHGQLSLIPVGKAGWVQCAGPGGRIGGIARESGHKYLVIWQSGKPARYWSTGNRWATMVNLFADGRARAFIDDGPDKSGISERMHLVSVSPRGFRSLGYSFDGEIRGGNPRGTAYLGRRFSKAQGWLPCLVSQGQVVLLRSPKDPLDPEAKAINNAGIIVGDRSGGVFAGGHALVWRDGKVLDLNDLIPRNSGWSLLSADGINAKGEIAGTGYFGGLIRAFLLKPIRQ